MKKRVVRNLEKSGHLLRINIFFILYACVFLFPLLYFIHNTRPKDAYGAPSLCLEQGLITVIGVRKNKGPVSQTLINLFSLYPLVDPADIYALASDIFSLQEKGEILKICFFAKYK